MATVTHLQALSEAVEALPKWLCNHIHRVEVEAIVLAQRFGEDVERARLAALGVRIAEHEVLANLATAPGITQQALAAR